MEATFHSFSPIGPERIASGAIAPVKRLPEALRPGGGSKSPARMPETDQSEHLLEAGLTLEAVVPVFFVPESPQGAPEQVL